MFDERNRLKELMDTKITRVAKKNAVQRAFAKLFGSGSSANECEGPGNLRSDGPRSLMLSDPKFLTMMLLSAAALFWSLNFRGCQCHCHK